MKSGKYIIVATFKYGKVWSNFAVAAMMVLATLMAFGIAFLSFVMWKDNARVAVFALFFDVFLIGLFIFEFIKAFRNRRYAKKCVKESIEKKTIVKLVDKDNGLWLNHKGVKIAVSFHEQGKKIRKHSVYDRVFKAYIDQEVIILYSPSNEGILLCKKILEE